MFFDRFDILSAYWLIGSDFHLSGMSSKEYAYMDRAEKAGFKPGAMFGWQSLSENAKEIYQAWVQKNKDSTCW
jgi:hypothetical protein